jgi:hypothetical protein
MELRGATGAAVPRRVPRRKKEEQEFAPACVSSTTQTPPPTTHTSQLHTARATTTSQPHTLQPRLGFQFPAEPLESSRAWPPHRPREDGLAHPAAASRPNLASALGLPKPSRFPKLRTHCEHVRDRGVQRVHLHILLVGAVEEEHGGRGLVLQPPLDRRLVQQRHVEVVPFLQREVRLLRQRVLLVQPVVVLRCTATV